MFGRTYFREVINIFSIDIQKNHFSKIILQMQFQWSKFYFWPFSAYLQRQIHLTSRQYCYRHSWLRSTTGQCPNCETQNQILGAMRKGRFLLALWILLSCAISSFCTKARLMITMDVWMLTKLLKNFKSILFRFRGSCNSYHNLQKVAVKTRTKHLDR